MPEDNEKTLSKEGEKDENETNSKQHYVRWGNSYGNVHS